MIKLFKNFPEIVALISQREDGDLSVLYDYERRKSQNPNRRVFVQKNGIPENNVVSALLNHGNEIAIVDCHSPLFIPRTDALLAKEKGIYLSVTSRDCYPVLAYDPREKIIAIIHAGWRGIARNIVPSVLDAMMKLGSSSHNIHIAIGPGICQAHFEFDEKDMKQHFGKYDDGKHVIRAGDFKVHIDLEGIILDQLLESKVKEDNIEVIGECTFCSYKKYFSARRDKSPESMIAIIGMRENFRKGEVLAGKFCQPAYA
ncbi:MAG: peptidoglycan editing factor PgeF [Candidatus Moranbacteria bacterium]|nr:peptidoglycan editing factor PgeF [Candidatus Moranbacteria bacterium]